ncbi:MAG: pilus assembly protein PilM [Desulfosarcina sp.]|nr:pilus assembly protein PilM [Desulfosarcina sp.]MBC2741955.1 pilus assembly protein PilM [Desulfosarcina sp.]MBC2764868.1 pilus assembly protein PilM [Desulfosarcina sp.]
MARKHEISSTEKLLDLIRGNASSPSTTNETAPAAPSQKPALFNALTFQKSIGIGVEIGISDIKIAKISRISDKSFELLDYDIIAIEPAETFDTPSLAKALAGILSRFCTGLKRYEIWCCVASAAVETRCIRIPKLPKKQIPNAVFWTFSKEVSFSDKEMLLDFRILGDVNENGMTKTQVMTFTIPIAETEALKRLFTRAGFPLTGISIVPFAIQNLLKTGIVQETGQDTCCLFIGRDWSRITIYANGDLILSRGIKAGIHSMIDAIAEQYRKPLQNDSSPALAMEDRDGESPDEQDAHYAAAQDDFYRFLGADSATDAAILPEDGKSIDIFQTILPAIKRLVKQVERTIAHFSMHFKRSGVSEILISGKVTASPAIISHIGSQLGVPVNVLNPFPQPHPFTQKVTVPDFPAIKESFVPAIGIGLSSNDLTPNFLFTYRHRERRNRARQIRIGISAASIGFLALLLCGFLWQENRIAAKSAEVARLTQKRDSFNVPLTQNLVMALYAKANQKRSLVTTLGQRYYSSAVMAEVSQLTPANIQLISLSADMGAPSEKSRKKTVPIMVIEGIVTGDQIRFETDLASYMLTMESSPLFKKPVMKNKRLQFLDDRQVLRFSIQFELA